MIWIIGSNGILGPELTRFLKEKGLFVIGSRNQTGSSDITGLKHFTEEYAVTLIINCTDYTTA